jgi:hypothetical protein
LIKTDWNIVAKEKPTVGSPFFVEFPSVRIPKATKDFNVKIKQSRYRPGVAPRVPGS